VKSCALGFDPAKAPDDRPIETSCDGWLRAALSARRHAGLNRSRREAMAGRNGSLLVGCWASGQGGRGKTGRGLYFLAGQKGKVLHNIFLNCFNVFRSIYV
jgi:hypothetical protein